MPSLVINTTEGVTGRETDQPGSNGNSTPLVSVVIVADHDTERHADLKDLRSCLQALASQEVDEPVEFLLVETDERARKLPADLITGLPGLRVLGVPHDGSYERKNAAVRAAQGDIIAILDADCIPVSGWLQSLINTLRSHPQHVAVSGRTVYEGKTALERSFSVLRRTTTFRTTTQVFSEGSGNGFRSQKTKALTPHSCNLQPSCRTAAAFSFSRP
jgi:cellulose synthase/poly-beta-1,6-N-acetylglucosamine synthase-like glycosyltransferase